MADIGGYAYVSPEVTLPVAITPGAGTASIGRSTVIFYKTSNGVWHMMGNISATASATAKSSVTLTFTGISISVSQMFATSNDTVATYTAYRNTATTVLTAHASASVTAYYWQFDVSLDTKPTAYVPDGV